MRYRIGDRVKFVKMPKWVKALPEESRLAFALCLHKSYPVVEITEEGLLVLDVSADVDPVLRSKFNDIRIESKYVAPACQPPR